MGGIESLFISLDYHLTLPILLAKIKEELRVDQVFVERIQGEETQGEIIEISGETREDIELYGGAYEAITSLLSRKIERDKKNYLTHEDIYDEEDTHPINRAELVFPIWLQTPEVVALNGEEDGEKKLENKLWGFLYIYDYDCQRKWQQKEIEKIGEIIQYIILAVERSFVYERLKMVEESCQSYSLLDEVTGLANYNSFMDCIDYEWRRLARERQPLSLILIVINCEKTLEDVTLALLGNIILEETKRPADLGAYCKENKFMVMLPNTDEKGATCVKNNMVRKIRSLLKSREDYTDCVLLCSVASVIPRHGESYSKILKDLEENLTISE
ncbi:MAG: diguanylate cyclase [Geminocystis sp.]|nr:diguanylate cyclase [Geminocystis sp.]HIK36508.1 diguanylate cyclase [Geminocystis sp. M7585_C2015_104]MCS7146747.1 diguanylate cyclase [Geminocystis sp.]MCX8077103.1 diguanylate cyclase [Geminocystis sp.]MDW8115573.1 diguanylate cyclase [Geminocystis sp.]